MVFILMKMAMKVFFFVVLKRPTYIVRMAMIFDVFFLIVNARCVVVVMRPNFSLHGKRFSHLYV